MSISLFAIKSFIDDWPQKSFLHEIIWQLHCGIDIESSPLQCTEEDSYFSFLPLAHVYDQIIESYCIYKGSSIGFWRGVRLRFIHFNEFFLHLFIWLYLFDLPTWFSCFKIAGHQVSDGWHPGTEAFYVLWGS